jgi:Ni/Fe-hydrogenase subunit HybB-like protein
MRTGTGRMGAHAGSTPLPGGYEGRTITHAPAWSGLVTWDLLFNGITTGLFLVAAVCELTAPGVFASTARVAYGVALVFLLVDLASLVLDLGDPLRFHHMLRVLKPGSPMSVGTWCLTLYSLPLTVAAAISVLPGDWTRLEAVRHVAIVAGLLPALGSAVYKGVLLSTNAQPGWKDARWLGGYLTSSAITLGCAGMLSLSLAMNEGRAAAALRLALGILVAANLIPLALLAVDVRAALARAYRPRELSGLASVCVVGGVLLPLCLLVAGAAPRALLAAALCVAVACLAIRFAIVRLPHASA